MSMSLSLRLVLLIIVATTTSAHVTFLDVAARAVTCGASKAARWYAGITSPTEAVEWYLCVSPLLHEWLGSSAIAATRGLAAATPGDEDHLRWSKAAHETRQRTKAGPEEDEEVAAKLEEKTPPATEAATPAPVSTEQSANVEMTEEEYRAVDEEIERKKAERFRKPRQVEKERKKKVEEETLAAPGCFPLNVHRSYLHLFLFVRQADPLTFAWLDENETDQMHAEAALNCAMARDANISAPDGPLSWVSNIIQRRLSVSSLLLFWRGPSYALAYFGWRAAIWALVGAVYFNVHAGLQALFAASTMFGVLAFGYWLWARWFANKSEKEQKNAARVWDVDPSLKTLKEKAASIAQWSCSWDRLTVVAWPHSAVVIFPYWLVRTFWRRAMGGAAIDPPTNFSELSRSFAAFVASSVQAQADVRRLVRETAEGLKEVRTLAKEIEARVEETATLTNSALAVLLAQEADVDTAEMSPPPIEKRDVESQTEEIPNIVKLETLLRVAPPPKTRAKTQAVRDARQVQSSFARKRTPSS